MSDAADPYAHRSPSPDAPPPADVHPDAWATACEEDLRAEKARRAGRDPRAVPGNPFDELTRLVDGFAERLGGLAGGLGGLGGAAGAGSAAQSVAQGAAQQFLNSARAAVEPVIDRNPQVFDHLAAAGNELLSAYRSAVQGSERRWSATRAETVHDETTDKRDMRDTPGIARPSEDTDGDDGPEGPHRIDLD